MINNKIIVLLVLYFISGICFAGNLDAQLSRDQITLGESVIVTYTLSNNANKVSPDFSVLQKDFRIINTNYGNTITMINGAITTKTSWRFALEPKKAGKLIIPEINFGNDKSIALNLTVIAAPTNSTNPSSDQQNGLVFVRGDVSSTTPYVQSQILYNFKLYFRTSLIRPSIEFPQIKDVTFFPLNDGQEYQTTVNGKIYKVVEKTFAIFPQKTGTINIAPVLLHALTSNGNSNNFFDFDAPKTITAATNDITLSVRDVPTNYQGRTWLPAKDLSLTEQWSENSARWEAGTPVTRTITIRAQGLRADQLPDLMIEKMNGVNVYVDQPKRDNIIQNNMVVGVLEQKVTYIPIATQSFTIPPLKINWWNTQTNVNAVSQLNGMNIQVKGVVGAFNPPVNPAVTQSSTTLNSPHPSTHEAVINTKFYRSIWFWITCVLLVAWIMTLLFILRKKNNPGREKEELVHPKIELSDKDFEQACQSGHAIQAQQYLLNWAKEYWPEMQQINLATLRELISDMQFKNALDELEQALYGKKTVKWDGSKLLTAFHKIKKPGNSFFEADATKKKDLNSKLDPLPPLNPLL